MASLNKKYAHYLSTHPLLTKSATGAVLATLNETIAALLSRDLTPSTLSLFGKSVEVASPINYKVPLLALFAFFVQAPFAHYSYAWLNSVSFFRQKPLSLAKKMLQMCILLLTITPVVCALNAAFLSWANNKELVSEVVSGRALKSKEKVLILLKTLKENGSKIFPLFLKSSWISSPLILFFAQNYLDTNSWVVFFNFAYFLLGTFQNTLLKIKMKKELQKKQESEKGEKKEI